MTTDPSQRPRGPIGPHGTHKPEQPTGFRGIFHKISEAVQGLLHFSFRESSKPIDPI